MVQRISLADAAEELPLADRGTYNLTLRSLVRKQAQSGQVYFLLTAAFTGGGHPNIKQTLFAPGEEDDAARAEERVREFVRLLKGFDIPLTEDDTMEDFEPQADDVQGATGDFTVYVGTDKDQDGEEYEVNKISLAPPRRYKTSGRG